MVFDYFVGIDWSGAKGHAHKGISVFTAKAGDELPQKQLPPDGKKAFSRADVIRYLEGLSRKGSVLAGIDFAFAYPVDDKGHYFPALEQGHLQPANAINLWALIDEVNEGADDYYGGLIWDHRPLGAYYNAPAGRKGARFESRRRHTEEAARAVKAPSPTFNCVGPAGVGTGSLAGMRLCHFFAETAEIWPFFSRPEASLRLVEIFPSYYFKLAGITPIGADYTKPYALNKALAYFGSAPVADDFNAEGPDADDADALISAAALRFLSQDEQSWSVPEIATREGWIFGVK